jgi:hypothetical protein
MTCRSNLIVVIKVVDLNTRLELEKYLCFTISNHGNHGKLLFFHSYECQGIQFKYSFDKILI